MILEERIKERLGRTRDLTRKLLGQLALRALKSGHRNPQDSRPSTSNSSLAVDDEPGKALGAQEDTSRELPPSSRVSHHLQHRHPRAKNSRGTNVSPGMQILIGDQVRPLKIYQEKTERIEINTITATRKFVPSE